MKSIQNCPGASSCSGGGPEPHQPLLEAARLERAGERLLEDEHDAVAALAQHLADARAVVGRAVGALGEEDDRGHRRQAARRAAIVMPSTIVTSTAVSTEHTNAAARAEGGIGAQRDRDAGHDARREHEPALGHPARPGEPGGDGVALHDEADRPRPGRRRARS